MKSMASLVNMTIVVMIIDYDDDGRSEDDEYDDDG